MLRGGTRSLRTMSSVHSAPETPQQRHPPRLRLCQTVELLMFGFILCPRFILLELFYSSWIHQVEVNWQKYAYDGFFPVVILHNKNLVN